jgi:uncharacterized membrane protein
MLLIILVASSVGIGMLLIAMVSLTEKTPDIWQLIIQLFTGQIPSNIPFFVPVSFLLFFSTTLASSVGIVYFIMIPEITPRKKGSNTVDVSELMNFLLPDERRVVEILIKHDGEYLQKHISKEANFTRLRTHRIIARLAQRGIVTVEKVGNTNMIRLKIKK